ncbi:MAG TPA: hypothetical protein VJ650_09890 [Gemmatimonadaceae bacterium]|nr:hypothetical protein [Gemmatimonadaceae bacterium]
MRVALYAASMFAILGCSSATGLARCPGATVGAVVCARLGEEFDLKVGQTAYIAETRLSIQVVAVPEDSRCPGDAVCVWAGNARVSLSLRDGTNTDAADVNSMLQPRAVTRLGYTIELIDVRPTPLSGQRLSLEAYVIRLVARRATS